MDPEPADFVCLDCNLRFKNSGTFDKHKRKFCQGRHENTWSPTAKSQRESSFSKQEPLLSRAQTSNSDFWARKPQTARSIMSQGQKIDHGQTLSRFGNFNQITSTFKYSSKVDELMAEQEKLEEHKRAIQEKILNMDYNKKRSAATRASTKGGRETKVSQQPTRERTDALETHLKDLQNSLNGMYNSHTRHGWRKNSTYNSPASHDNGYGYSLHLEKLKRQYIQDGGNDIKILNLINEMEKDIYEHNRSRRHGEDSTLQFLKEQLTRHEEMNQTLLQEIQDLRSRKDIQTEQLQSFGNSQQELMRRDVASLHEKRLMEMRQEAEIYRQQLELERLKGELHMYRGGIPQLPQLPAIPYNQGQNSLSMSAQDRHQISNERTEEAFQASPYDPGNGFAIFWDFLCGIIMATDRCRIAVTLFKDDEPVSDTKVLPAVPFNQANRNTISAPRYSGRTAVLGIKQVFPQCLPLQSLTVAIQVQMGSQHDETFNTMQEVGWSLVDVFDNFNRVVVGRWKVPVRIPPMAPHLTAAQRNTVQQLDGCELYYRLINARDTVSQDGLVLSEQQKKQYKYPPLEHKILQMANVTLEPRRKIISRAESPEKPSTNTRKQSPVKSPVVTPTQEPAPRTEPAPEPVRVSPKPPSKEPTPLLEPSPQLLSPELLGPSDVTQKKYIGFQIDKLYDVLEVTARLQITVYGADGKIAQSGSTLATRRSHYAQSAFYKSVLAFSLEEVVFDELVLDSESFAIIGVYTTAAGGYLAPNQTTGPNDEQLICWTLLRLTLVPGDGKRNTRNTRRSNRGRESLEEEEDLLQENTGRHELSFYRPPVLDVRHILASFKNSRYFDPCEKYENTIIQLFIFNETVLPPALPLDIPEYTLEQACPKGAWIENKRTEAPSTIFKNGDGFELYIDAIRFLPDNCAFVKFVVERCDGMQIQMWMISRLAPSLFRGLSARGLSALGKIITSAGALVVYAPAEVICQLYDSRYTKLKEEFESDIDLELDPYMPNLDLKFEFREFTYPPTATIIFKIYMVDAITKAADRLGVSILPVFVKQGTFDRSDDNDAKFCLNEGSFQLKIYNELKNTDRLIKSSVDSPVLCSSLLVRLLPAPCYADGQPKQASEFLEDQLESEGLLIPKQSYAKGKYDTSDCPLNVMECRTFHAFMNRTPTSVRDAMKLVATGNKAKNDKGLTDTIKALMKNLQNLPSADVSYIAKYNSMHGVVFSVDSAQNLPWSGFTFATYCFSPPASFYKGKLDDQAVLVTKLDLDGFIRLPKWNDGIQMFPRRRSHTNLVVLVQLYELLVSPSTNTQASFNFGAQAWTVIPVLNQGYANHGLFQVGIFHDAPPNEIVDKIQTEPLIPTIADLRKRKIARLVDGASIFVRIGDARRREELENRAKLTVRKTFLPRGNKFLNPVLSKRFSTIMPANQNAEEHLKVLASKFRMLAGQKFQQRVPRS